LKEIITEISINTSPEKVWKILTDFENQSSWNPFITSISGEKKVGGKLSIIVQPGDGGEMKFKPTVLVLSENKELRWKGKLLISGLFAGEHYFILNSTDHNTTQLIHGEKFSGILVGLFGSMLNKTKQGFELMNSALKKECEK